MRLLILSESWASFLPQPLRLPLCQLDSIAREISRRSARASKSQMESPRRQLLSPSRDIPCGNQVLGGAGLSALLVLLVTIKLLIIYGAAFAACQSSAAVVCVRAAVPRPGRPSCPGLARTSYHSHCDRCHRRSSTLTARWSATGCDSLNPPSRPYSVSRRVGAV